jgi:hypothetical protein
MGGLTLLERPEAVDALAARRGRRLGIGDGPGVERRDVTVPWLHRRAGPHTAHGLPVARVSAVGAFTLAGDVWKPRVKVMIVNLWEQLSEP